MRAVGESWPPPEGPSQLPEASDGRLDRDLSVVLNSSVPTLSSCDGAQRGLAVCLGLHSKGEARHWDLWLGIRGWGRILGYTCPRRVLGGG